MLRFCDGFDSYGATADLLKKYATATGWTWNATSGRNGGGCITLAAATGTLECQFGTAPEVSGSAISIAFWLKATAPPAAASQIIQMVSSGPTTQPVLGISTSGFLTYLNTAAGVMATGTLNVCDGNWHWIEFYFLMQNSSASSTGYADGIVQWTGSTYSPSTGFNMDHFKIACTSAMTITIDDIIIYDNTAPAPTLSIFPTGSRQIVTSRPASDGTVTFGTTSSGSTHFNLVNEVNPDGDTSWVQDGTSGDQDLYNYSALGYVPNGISAVVVNNYVRNPDVGSINFASVCKSGATTTPGATIATPLVYNTYQTAYGVDPNTSAAWTAAGLAAAQFGIKVP